MRARDRQAETKEEWGFLLFIWAVWVIPWLLPLIALRAPVSIFVSWAVIAVLWFSVLTRIRSGCLWEAVVLMAFATAFGVIWVSSALIVAKRTRASHQGTPAHQAPQHPRGERP